MTTLYFIFVLIGLGGLISALGVKLGFFKPSRLWGPTPASTALISIGLIWMSLDVGGLVPALEDAGYWFGMIVFFSGVWVGNKAKKKAKREPT